MISSHSTLITRMMKKKGEPKLRPVTVEMKMKTVISFLEGGKFVVKDNETSIELCCFISFSMNDIFHIPRIEI